MLAPSILRSCHQICRGLQSHAYGPLIPCESTWNMMAKETILSTAGVLARAQPHLECKVQMVHGTLIRAEAHCRPEPLSRTGLLSSSWIAMSESKRVACSRSRASADSISARIKPPGRCALLMNEISRCGHFLGQSTTEQCQPANARCHWCIHLKYTAATLNLERVQAYTGQLGGWFPVPGQCNTQPDSDRASPKIAALVLLKGPSGAG